MKEVKKLGYPLKDVYSVKNSFNRIDDVQKCFLKGINKTSATNRKIGIADLVNNKKKMINKVKLVPEK